MKTAILGNGCFWCTEAVFKRLKGVVSVVPGFSGGTIKNPAYREVIAGRTGHAEVLKIVYDETIIDFKKLLTVFFETHDPTTLNRQGNDIGTQYRSAIFYQDENQKSIAETILNDFTNSGVFENPIVTEITKFVAFYEAENYHHDYFESHQHEPYCNLVINPKLKKFVAKFQDDLK
ncbi:peptide-methionine (S)-S-oxide reductase MsrA [Flavicella marina]|uniref:peptide-methionine (S)-S-oxide reductase MsrA n=1 Tax=Flavicella marina TaxID=1475951 RepID=UPI0012640E3E|nr:peptide-methionine (S)-S-oxide reductase MsrA [Flavicella marina]